MVAAVAGGILFIAGRLIKYRIKKKRYLANRSPRGGFLHTVPGPNEE